MSADQRARRDYRKKHIMPTVHNCKKKLITSTVGAAAVAPALLFIGAGTAHADSLNVYAQPAWGGVTVTVANLYPTQDLTGCVTAATPPWGVPYLSPPFNLTSTAPSFGWFVPSWQTDTNWTIGVNCLNGGQQTVTPSTITY